MKKLSVIPKLVVVNKMMPFPREEPSIGLFAKKVCGRAPDDDDVFVEAKSISLDAKTNAN